MPVLLFDPDLKIQSLTSEISKLWSERQIWLATYFVNKVLLEHTHARLFVVFGYICVIMVELSSFNRNL